MSSAIFRGSTPTLVFKPDNGMHVSDLGTPTVAVAQAVTFISYEGDDIVIDTENNAIRVKMSEQDTLSLVPGVPTQVQQIWTTDESQVIRFPLHELTVMETLVENLYDMEVYGNVIPGGE